MPALRGGVLSELQFAHVGSGQFENTTSLDYKAFVKTVLPALRAEERMSPALDPPLASPALRTQLWLIRGTVLLGEGQDSGQEKSEPGAGR